MRTVGQDANLIAAVGFCPHGSLTQRHTQQGCGDFLARAQQSVQLTRGRVRLNLLCEPEQPVGFPGHSRHHHDHIVAVAFKASHSIGDCTDPLYRADRGATVFLDNERHNSRGVSIEGRVFNTIRGSLRTSRGHSGKL